jgi:RNA polymerase sigma factor (sigma-70 family)
LEHTNTIHADLVKQAGKGSRFARAELYRLYGKAMYNTCIRMTGNIADAEDILHDAFIHAFEHLGQLREPAAFGGWLRRIVIGKCTQASRSYYRLKEFDDSYADTLGETEQDEWWNNITLEQMHEEIKKLPDGCRQVFVLFVFEDFGHKQIAENLGISESTSKSQYHRAKQLLRERITRQIPING